MVLDEEELVALPLHDAEIEAEVDELALPVDDADRVPLEEAELVVDPLPLELLLQVPDPL